MIIIVIIALSFLHNFTFGIGFVLADLIPNVLCVGEVDGCVDTDDYDTVVSFGLWVVLNVSVLGGTRKTSQNSSVWISTLKDDEQE